MPSQNVIGEKNSNGAEIGTAQLSEPKAKKFVFPSQSVIGELNLLTIVMPGSGRQSRQTGYKSPL